jgi:hypothetical protein
MLGRSGLPGRSELQPGHPSPGAIRPEAPLSFHPSALIALIALLAHLKFGKPSPGTVSAYAPLPPPRQDDQLINLIILIILIIFVKQRTYLARPPR